MKLYMAVDFFDDMIPIAWDRKRLKEFMELNARTGVKRICWIYYGDRYDGFWENTGTPWRKNYMDTFDALGDSYLKAAVEEAHAAGLEIFGVYKPFDIALQTYPTRDCAGKVRVPVVGGSILTAFNFPIEHRNAMMRRRNIQKKSVSRIILRLAEELAPNHQFRLWGSNNNRNYKPVGIFSSNSDKHKVVFDISGLTSNFFAIENLGSELSNRIDSIIEVQSADGEMLQCSLGLEPRIYYAASQTYHLDNKFDVGDGFSQDGFLFDYLPGPPSSVFRGEYWEQTFSLSGKNQNVIGVALDVNDCVPGAPEPAEPAAIEYWQGMIGRMLNYGVDGVDIRISNHNSVLDWSQYGFNEPVMNEYIKRYGVDPRREEFDQEKLRRLRGEFYTAFLEKAAMLVKNAGRKFCVHIPDKAFGSPSQTTMMEIHWDWRDWLKKGIPDEVTFKALDPDSVFSPEGLEVIKRCREQALPVSVCPFLHLLSEPGTYLEKMEKAGLNSFTVYEAATVWAATKNGFVDIDPAVTRSLQNVSHGL